MRWNLASYCTPRSLAPESFFFLMKWGGEVDKRAEVIVPAGLKPLGSEVRGFSFSASAFEDRKSRCGGSEGDPSGFGIRNDGGGNDLHVGPAFGLDSD